MAKGKKDKAKPVEAQEAEVAESAAAEGAEGGEGEAEAEGGVEVLDEEKGEKAPRVVTRYGVEYDGNAYTSPRKALDAAGLTEVKGSRLRARFKKAGNAIGTEVEYEGKKFKYIEVPASAEADESEAEEAAEETEE
jgi:hypothetical protein